MRKQDDTPWVNGLALVPNSEIPLQALGFEPATF